MTVPENHFWISREITVDEIQTHSWFTQPPFRDAYLKETAIMEDDIIYLYYMQYFKKQTHSCGKVIKSTEKFISNNISVYPVYFEGGRQLTTNNEKVKLNVYEYKVCPENWGKKKSDLELMIEKHGGIDKYAKHLENM